MSDGGMKVIVHTQELASSDKGELMNLHKKIGWFVFSVTGIEEADIPEGPVEFEGQKTDSERLRNVLFRLHETQGGKPEDFESYRVKIMEKLINNYKSKLDDLEMSLNTAKSSATSTRILICCPDIMKTL
jgi:hypothetical protein